MKCSFIFSLVPMAFAACSLVPEPANAQTSPLLQVETITLTKGGPATLVFRDDGTGATNYAVEFAPALGSSATWSNVASAVLSDLGGGQYRFSLAETPRGTGFLRIRGLGGGAGAVTVSFAAASVQGTEGQTIAATLTFSAPFTGSVRYTVSGTADSGDYVTLSGEVAVHGQTTATIPVSLKDNSQIGQLKYLTLRLAPGTGYSVGSGGPDTTITIYENDANWKGTFTAENATLGFTLQILQAAGLYQATLKGDGSGFFPTYEVPASVAFGANTFAANASGIPLPASATLLNVPAALTLLLSAQNGQTNQSVSAALVQGVGTLIAQYAGYPQLNTTNTGTFQLFKPPISPSTNDVPFIAGP